jgi:hypothetical protein
MYPSNLDGLRSRVERRQGRPGTGSRAGPGTGGQERELGGRAVALDYRELGGRALALDYVDEG